MPQLKCHLCGSEANETACVMCGKHVCLSHSSYVSGKKCCVSCLKNYAGNGTISFMRYDVSKARSNLMSCPDCNKEISVRALTCPHCGCPTGSVSQTQDATASSGEKIATDKRESSSSAFSFACLFVSFIAFYTPLILVNVVVIAAIILGVVAFVRKERWSGVAVLGILMSIYAFSQAGEQLNAVGSKLRDIQRELERMK